MKFLLGIFSPPPKLDRIIKWQSSSNEMSGAICKKGRMKVRYRGKSTLEIRDKRSQAITRSVPEAAKQDSPLFLTMGISTDYRPPSRSLPIFFQAFQVCKIIGSCWNSGLRTPALPHSARPLGFPRSSWTCLPMILYPFQHRS